MKEEADNEIDEDDHDNILGEDYTDARNVEKVLQKLIQDVISQGDYKNDDSPNKYLASVSFRRFVALLRRMGYPELMVLGEAALSCRNFAFCNSHFDRAPDDHVLQSIRERILTKALMTCGSESCVRVFAEQWLVAGRLSAMMEEATVTVNMGLFYTPTPIVAETLMNYCANKQASWCWLSLSAMLKRMFDVDPERKEAKIILYNTLKHILELAGDTCTTEKTLTSSRPGREAAEKALATAVKVRSLFDMVDKIDR
ncbi:hypothetical protein ElyMa_006885300 [Elysia marginata]|uniref:Uncharacterized protein n=1 Tax=Elysia marginata TaxID=1093978 RepID=A0AAV4JDB8_9GAST|nr:hypothetical protein ElyMa_006885300 [Elysia marginata]